MAHKTFIRIDTIQGESTDPRHRDEIEVLAWNWSVSVTVSTGGRGGGGAHKPAVTGLSFTHRIDKASPQLMAACFSGKHLAESVLRIPATTGNFDYYVIKMREIIINSIVQTDKAEDGFPSETVTLGFSQIAEEYTEVKHDGTPGSKTVSCYDLVKNKPC